MLANGFEGADPATALLSLDPLRPLPMAGAHLKSWGIDINDFTPEEVEEMEANLRKQLEAKGIDNPLIRLELYSGCVYMVARVHAPGADPQGEPVELDMLAAVPQRIRDRLTAHTVVPAPLWAARLALYARPLDDPTADPAHLVLQVLAKGLGPADPCALTPCVWSSKQRGALLLHASDWEVLGPDDSVCTVVIDRIAMPDVLTIRLGEFSLDPEPKLRAISDATVAVPLIPLMLAGSVTPDLQGPLAHVMEYAFRQAPPRDAAFLEPSEVASTGAPRPSTPPNPHEGAVWSDLAWALSEEVETRGIPSLTSFLRAEVLPLVTRNLPSALLGRRVPEVRLRRTSSRNLPSPTTPPGGFPGGGFRNGNSPPPSQRFMSSLAENTTQLPSRRSRPSHSAALPFASTEQQSWTLTFKDPELETLFLRECLMPRVELADLVSIFSSIPVTYLLSRGCAGRDVKWRFVAKALSRGPWLMAIVLGMSRRFPRAYLLVPLVAQWYDAAFESAPSPFYSECLMGGGGKGVWKGAHENASSFCLRNSLRVQAAA